jgi:hypothetical protein
VPAVLGRRWAPVTISSSATRTNKRGTFMWRRLILVSSVIFTALALVAPSSGAFLQQAHLTVLTNGRKPTWKLAYLLCHTGRGPLGAEVSEFSYLQGAKSRTLQVWTWGKKGLRLPSKRGAGGRCSWYHSETHRSRFPQRAGYVTGVTLEIFDPSGRTITRNFRLHP